MDRCPVNRETRPRVPDMDCMSLDTLWGGRENTEIDMAS